MLQNWTPVTLESKSTVCEFCLKVFDKAFNEELAYYHARELVSFISVALFAVILQGYILSRIASKLSRTSAFLLAALVLLFNLELGMEITLDWINMVHPLKVTNNLDVSNTWITQISQNLFSLFQKVVQCNPSDLELDFNSYITALESIRTWLLNDGAIVRKDIHGLMLFFLLRIVLKVTIWICFHAFTIAYFMIRAIGSVCFEICAEIIDEIIGFSSSIFRLMVVAPFKVGVFISIKLGKAVGFLLRFLGIGFFFTFIFLAEDFGIALRAMLNYMFRPNAPEIPAPECPRTLLLTEDENTPVENISTWADKLGSFLEKSGIWIKSAFVVTCNFCNWLHTESLQLVNRTSAVVTRSFVCGFESGKPIGRSVRTYASCLWGYTVALFIFGFETVKSIGVSALSFASWLCGCAVALAKNVYAQCKSKWMPIKVLLDSIDFKAHFKNYGLILLNVVCMFGFSIATPLSSTLLAVWGFSIFLMLVNNIIEMAWNNFPNAPPHIPPHERFFNLLRVVNESTLMTYVKAGTKSVILKLHQFWVELDFEIVFVQFVLPLLKMLAIFLKMVYDGCILPLLTFLKKFYDACILPLLKMLATIVSSLIGRYTNWVNQRKKERIQRKINERTQREMGRKSQMDLVLDEKNENRGFFGNLGNWIHGKAVAFWEAGHLQTAGRNFAIRTRRLLSSRHRVPLTLLSTLIYFVCAAYVMRI